MSEEIEYSPVLNETSELIQNRISATYRAITKDKEVEVSFGANNQASNVAGSVRLPSVQTTSKNGLDVARGEADFSAFKYRYHSEKIHRKNRPTDETHAMLFNALEDARIEAIGSDMFAGLQIILIRL